MSSDGLRELEHLVLLAISRLEPLTHGVPIVQELRQTVKRRISRASVYVVLRRLEAKGMVVSTMGDPTPQRGGRAKRLYRLTPLAVRTLRTAQRDFVRLWAGSRVLGALLFVLLAGATGHAAAARQAADAPVFDRPDLTGTWLSLSDPNAVDIATASTLPNALLTIRHERRADGDRIHLERSWSAAPIAATFVCDGRENTNGYSLVVERTTCQWEGPGHGTLVIAGTIGRQEPGPPRGALTQRYRVDEDGILVVERTRELFSQQVTPPGPRTTTQRYRKVTPAPGEKRR